MPITVTETSGNDVYASPFIGPVNHPVQLPVDVSTLLIDGALGAQVDTKGYLKPGTPFKLSSGKLVPLDATAAEYVYGVVIEATKIVSSTVPVTNAILAAITADPIVAVATHGLLNRDIVEDNLGRALGADELAAFAAAGSQLNLTTT
jgi:hypothetical protein